MKLNAYMKSHGKAQYPLIYILSIANPKIPKNCVHTKKCCFCHEQKVDNAAAATSTCML